MEITYRARSYYIEKIEQETEEALSHRAWFIVKTLDPDCISDRKHLSVYDKLAAGKNNPNSNTMNIESSITFDEAVLLSKYWYYIRKYDCRYAQNIMDKVAMVEKLLYV